MAPKGNQKLKILYILDILKKNSDENHPLNAPELVALLEKAGITAERKSVYDDIAMLESFGYDIIKTATPKTGWFIGDREFEVPEIYLLSDAVRSAKFISAKKTRELLHKLNGLLSCYQAKRRTDGVFFEANEKSGNEEIYYHIDTISRAIDEKRKLKLAYCSRRLGDNRQVVTETKTMRINPYALCWSDDHYYLIGNYEKYDNLIHLRLDRIGSVEMTDEPARHFSEVSEYTAFFDTADYTRKLFGMYGGELAEVELFCRKEITEPVLDRFGADIFISRETEEGFHIRVKAALSDALVTWVINFGDKIKVIRPESLQQRIIQRAACVLRNYEKPEKE